MKDFEKYLEEKGYISLAHMEEDAEFFCTSSYHINKNGTIGVHKVDDDNYFIDVAYYMYSIGKKDGKEKEIITLLNWTEDILELDNIVLNSINGTTNEEMLEKHLKATSNYRLVSDEKKIKENLLKLPSRSKEFEKIFYG